MAEMRITCPEHGDFSAGVEFEPGGAGGASFIGCTATCPRGHDVPIPDGLYTVNSFGVVVLTGEAS